MQTAWKRVGALARLAIVEANSLLWPWGCGALALIVALAALTEYLAPPFWFAERGELAATQSTATTYLALLVLVLGWVWARHHGSRGAWLARLDATVGVIAAEAAGLAAAVLVLATLTTVAINTLYRILGIIPPADGTLAVGMALLGFATLAPGLSRLPVAKPLLLLVCAGLVVGELGLLGTAFPLRAARLWARPDLAPWFLSPHPAPDVMVALAGLFVSFGVGRTVRRGS